MGWWQGGLWGVAIGVGAATWLWFFWDLWRGSRVLRWLRHGDLGLAPQLYGMLGEAADRARRLIRQGHLETKASDERLQQGLRFRRLE